MIDSEAAAASTSSTRERSLALCRSSLPLTDLSRPTPAQSCEARQLRVRTRAGRETVRRESIIARKLRTGHLPIRSVPIIVGGPGAGGGNCDGCDTPLTSAEMVMAIPSDEQTFVHLHADCFIIWN